MLGSWFPGLHCRCARLFWIFITIVILSIFLRTYFVECGRWYNVNSNSRAEKFCAIQICLKILCLAKRIDVFRPESCKEIWTEIIIKLDITLKISKKFIINYLSWPILNCFPSVTPKASASRPSTSSNVARQGISSIFTRDFFLLSVNDTAPQITSFRTPHEVSSGPLDLFPSVFRSSRAFYLVLMDEIALLSLSKT